MQLKKKISLIFLLGLAIGTLFFGGYFAYSAIQSEVGINFIETTTGAWVRIGNYLNSASDSQDGGITPAQQASILDTHSEMFGFNETGFDRIRAGFTLDGRLGTGLLNPGLMAFNGTTWDRIRSASSDAFPATGLLANGQMIFNGTTWDRVRDANIANATTGTGIPSSGMMLLNGTLGTWHRIGNLAGIGSDGFAGASVAAMSPSLFNGVTGDRQRSISATSLTATTSVGTALNAPLATWNVTNAPAAATQATASQAAGGGTVRHVVTSWSACLYTATAATVPVAQSVVVRDGTTGAGTIFNTQAAGSGVIQGAQCSYSPPGYSRIGTANTAMTIEFSAAPPADVLQTVNMAGYSVP